jgi:RimJ/RimL family protein N-acetyltransferase
MAFKLRPPMPSDSRALVEMARESVETTYPFQAWCHQDFSLQDAKDWVNLSIETQELKTAYHFVIETSDEIRLLGTLSLHSINEANAVGQLGYFVRESERGQGIAVEAAKRLIDFAFKDLKLHRLEILIATHNHNSERVAKKLGAEKEAVLKERLKWNDQFFDAALYVLFGNKK